MKLIKITIQNFRSISLIDSFEPLDKGIISFIGPNGSGKSNILKAIALLKSVRILEESDIHVQENETDAAHISTVFIFDQKDEEILKENGLSLNYIEGFKVELNGIVGKPSGLVFSPIGYTKDIFNKTVVNLTRMRAAIKKAPLPTELAKQKTSLLEMLKGLYGFQEEELKAKLPEIINLASVFEKDVPIIGEVLVKLDSLNKFNVTEAIKKIWETLTIELLDIESYKIEQGAPITELTTRKEHPFVFDLLQLSGKTASDFEKAQGPRKIRIREAASYKLTKEIKNVWGSHELDFVIDKDNKDEWINFCVRTPQGHAIGLENLSDGQKWFLRYYARLAISKKEGKQIIWLFDEPGKDLHAKSQIDLRNFFEGIAESSQIFYTSHQPMMIPWHRLERIFVVENLQGNDERGVGTVVHKRFWQDNELSSPLKEALALFVGEDLLLGSQHVIVEGTSDFFYLMGWLRHFQNVSRADIWKKDYATLSRSFLPIGGYQKIPLYISFLTRDTGRVDCVAVMDSSTKTEDLKNILVNSGLGVFTKKVKTIGEILEIKAKNHKADFDIEDLFEPREYMETFSSFYKEKYPSVALPSPGDLGKITTAGPRITKRLEEHLLAKNPGYKINGRGLRLDKTGIAQSVYLTLTASQKNNFSKKTEVRFRKLLAGINNLFK